MEMAKKWCRAVWKEGKQEEEGTIPSIWIVNQQVMWPKAKNVLKIMQEQKEPDETWESFPLIKIKLKSDNKKECELYDDTTTAELSDDDSQEMEMMKRKSKKKIYSDFIVDEDCPQPDDHHARIKKSQCKQALDLPPPPAPPSRNSARNNLEKGKRQSCHNTASYKETRNEDDFGPERISAPRSMSRSPLRRIRSRSPLSVQRCRARSGSRSPLVSPRRLSPLLMHRPVSRSRSPLVHSPSLSSMYRHRSRSRTPIASHHSSSSSSSMHRHRSRSPIVLHRSSSSRHSSQRSRSPYRSRPMPSTSSSSSSINRSRPVSSRDRSPIVPDVTPGADRSQRKEIYPMPEERFQKRVLFLLCEIRDLLKHGSKKTDDVDEEEVELRQSENLEGFKMFDESLNDKKEYSVHKKLVSQIGGSDFGDHLKKTMQRCMSNKAMSDMNLSGKKNKYSFGKSNLCKIIKEVVLKKYPSTTESMVAEKAASYLKFTPERTGGGGRKQQRPQN